MTRGEIFITNAKGTHGHRSTVSSSAWCDLNKNCTVLKLLDMGHNPKSNCQIQNTFTTEEFQLQGRLNKSKLQNFLRGHKLLGINI